MYRKKSGIYYYDFKVCGVRYQGSTGSRDRREAERFQENQKSLIVKSTEQLVLSLTLNEAIERMWGEVWSQQESGLQTRRRVEVISRLLGNPNLTEITTSSITVARNDLLTKLTEITTRKYLKHLAQLLRRAKDTWDLLDKRPRVELPKAPQGTRRVISKEEERSLLETTRDSQWAPYEDLWVFLLNTGMRVGEALSLKTTDYDARARLIRVRAETTKTKRGREIPANDAAHTVLTNRLPEWFPGVNSDRVAKIFKKLRVRMGLGADTGVTAHSLRHTFCTRLLQAGVDIETVRALAGHTKITTTALYLHADTRTMRAGVETL